MSEHLTFTIPDPHPSCEGHFPDAPVLPAVVLLDLVLTALEGTGSPALTVTSAKFLSPVRPGQSLTLAHESAGGGGLRFTLQRAGQTVVSGLLRPARP
jgi:3-hydroxymyristoyl/3-hydroxydecanoyl-(acyl carrier protein) dehydratase